MFNLQQAFCDFHAYIDHDMREKIQNVRNHTNEYFFEIVFVRKLEENIVRLADDFHLMEKYGHLADFLWRSVIYRGRYQRSTVKVLPYLVPYLHVDTNVYLNDVLFHNSLIYGEEDAFLVGKLIDYEKYGNMGEIMEKLICRGELDMIQFIYSQVSEKMNFEPLHLELAILFGWPRIVDWLLTILPVTWNPLELKHISTLTPYYDVFSVAQSDFHQEIILNDAVHSHEEVMFILRKAGFQFSHQNIPNWYKFMRFLPDFQYYLPVKDVLCQMAGMDLHYPSRETVVKLKEVFKSRDVWDFISHWEHNLIDFI